MESQTRMMLLVPIVLMLVGCFERSVSGTYVAKRESGAELMQLTQTSDGKLVGSLQRVALNTQGALEKLQLNVIGAVDGESLTLTMARVGIPITQNFSGAVTDSGLELNMVDNSGAALQARFARSNIEEFNAAVGRLTQAGQSIKSESARVDQVEALNRSALALERSLNAYVARAEQQIDKTPSFMSYFSRANKEVSERLQYVQRITSGGDNEVRGLQANTLLNQITASESPIRNTSESIDQAIEEIRREETSLNARLIAFNGICLGSASTVKCSGLMIPDTHLGENTRQIEVSDDQATSFLFR
ncbi:hypothetical protein [Pseudomonas gingeri]|uniref:hypothetical protein n=1 Tax=Pseudomonas gingeri TaxID=117681 RepID=UPI0015A0BF91|nr:hypothetical protein [Pseudomonas gingeri]NWA05396.1 hypothetical protein [Pseudomonas gingeri]NWA17819.1 hypothetical protein [Pseudomonas gingeri]NWA57783.1 hypothetical protein [Pseudomonas gingeri]NWA98804.1 hypothetical protein [Pseudomonas gingeri]NWB05930.1 hypothetical protein [Pseudomonas gingeri]